MEDTYPQSDEGIDTDKNRMPNRDEERLAHSFDDNDLFHADSLITHNISNTGLRQFSCIQCDKAFSRSSCLKKHKLVHTEEKQFVCDQCNKVFTRSGSLMEHKLSHTGEK